MQVCSDRAFLLVDPQNVQDLLQPQGEDPVCWEGARVEVGGVGEGGLFSLVQRDNYSL